MFFEGDANDDDDVIMLKVNEVKARMQRMIDDGLKKREHIFW
jgi:hypothetical protein